MDKITQLRNRIVDITIAITQVDRQEFFKLKNKKRYAKIRNVCIVLMFNRGVYYEDIATTFKMTFQNVYYQLSLAEKWKEFPEKHAFELDLYAEIEKEVLNKESELTLY